jgi:YegS/Rv2252/BmrU family lipid kinase
VTDAIRIILNPTSGSGAGRKVLSALEGRIAARQLPYHVEVTQGPGHARNLARQAAEQGAQAVLAAGGDGTIHEVANGLLETGRGTALAVLPIGTGNDFHRMVGSDRSLDGALDLLETGERHQFDVGLARWEGGESRFVNVLGVGVDTDVLRNRDRYRRLRGVVQYAVAAVAAAVRYRPVSLAVDLDGVPTFTDRTTLAAVTVGPSIGGGFRVSPGARPDDGLLDLLFVEALSVFQVVRYLPKVLRGTHQDAPVVRMHTVKQLRFASPDGDPFHFELDGELLPDPTATLDVEVVPAALTVLRPGGTTPV